MKEVKTVGVVGFGVMGAAIGLNAAASGYRVVYKELNQELVETMYRKFVVDALSKRVEKGKMTQADMDEICGKISGTVDYADMAQCDLIIEAAVEKMDLKIEVFRELSEKCPKEIILVSNTSTFLIEKLMEKVDNPSRAAGLHYFFPANVNRLVEVIRQKQTGDDTYQALMAFATKNGKVPITVRDFPGFAINPLFISSYLVLDGFLGNNYNVATLDDISREALGLKFGIMWVQNGAGLGTCYHAGVSLVDHLGDSAMGFPPMPAALKDQFKSGHPWNLEDGQVLANQAARSLVADHLLGSVFAVSTHLVENQVVTVRDLELGVRTSLAWPKGPFTLMNEMGMKVAAEKVKTAEGAGYFGMPKKFAAGDMGLWEV